MYRPGTGYTAVYSCFNNCLQSVLTRYRLQSLCTAYPTPQLVTVILPSSFNSVLILGQVSTGIWGRYLGQVSTNMASADRLQSLQITRSVYRLYSLIFTKTSYRVITSTTGYRAYQQGTGYTALLHQTWLQSLPT